MKAATAANPFNSEPSPLAGMNQNASSLPLAPILISLLAIAFSVGAAWQVWEDENPPEFTASSTATGTTATTSASYSGGDFIESHCQGIGYLRTNSVQVVMQDYVVEGYSATSGPLNWAESVWGSGTSWILWGVNGPVASAGQALSSTW